MKSWDTLYQAQLARYNSVMDSDHNMDSKGGVLLGAILVIAVFALDKSLFSTDNKLLFAILILGCFLYSSAVLLLIYAVRPREYTLPANSTKDHPEYMEMEAEQLVYQLVVDTEYATSKVEGMLRKKSLIVTISIFMFVVGTIALLIVKLAEG